MALLDDEVGYAVSPWGSALRVPKYSLDRVCTDGRHETVVVVVIVVVLWCEGRCDEVGARGDFGGAGGVSGSVVYRSCVSLVACFHVFREDVGCGYVVGCHLSLWVANSL